jgi:Melibiase
MRCEVGPLLHVSGDMRTLPDPRARVVVRGTALEASWPDGLRVRFRARAQGRGYRLDCSVSSTRAVVVGAIGARFLGMTASRLCVDGYHSWDWAGVRSSAGSGLGWWGGVWGDPGGAQVAVALDAPPRLGPLLLRWNEGRSLGAMSVGAPEQLSHATGEPRLLEIRLEAGATLHGDPLRIAPVDRRSPWGVGVPRLAAGDRVPLPRIAGWMSWNCLGPAATAADVIEAAATLAPPGGLVLLDDGWMSRWGDWQEREDFDSTIADLADAVHAAGRRFGLWVAPFLVAPRSRIAAARGGDLLLRSADGEPVVSVRSPSPMHVIDASRRVGRAHLAALGRRLGRLGVDALKLDFLFAGGLPGARGAGRSQGGLPGARGDGGTPGALPAARAGREMSDIAALRAGVASLTTAYRNTAPRGARVLACGAPAAPLVGLVDACRSGDDAVANVPPAGMEPPPRPWFTFGEALLRAQARNYAARSWLWGATVPPDVDAVTLAAAGDTPTPDDGFVQRWLQLAARSGGPLLDSDTPDGRVTVARRRLLRRAQLAVQGAAPRPERSDDPLAGSAVDHNDATFHEWPDELPAPWDW